MDHKKILPVITLFIIVWSGFVVAAYFVVQKPLVLQVIDHLVSLAWTLSVTSVVLLNALALGIVTIKRFLVDMPREASFLTLAGGIGLGELGLLGFALAAMGASNLWILLAVQSLILAWSAWGGILASVVSLINSSISEIKSSGKLIPPWMKWAVAVALILTFLMTFLPPVEAYDALLYHLTVPQLWLRDAGLRAYNIPPYWFPGIVEGAYVWGLGMGTDIVPQQLHFFWAVFTVLLLWNWSRKLWDDLTAWWACILCVSMPSLLLLAAWAYTDLALAFFSIATLYTLWQGHNGNNTRWWRIAGITAGMAMGVKYTSVVVILTAILLIAVWRVQQRKAWLGEMMWFGLLAGLTGSVWYLRNWIWMGNPFYPFVFGGKYWDEFRAAWYAGAGTGAGWDLKAVLSLPLTITLGYQDITAFDGNIGPLFLLSLPMALWALVRIKNFDPAQQRALGVICLFVFLSASSWTYGYITTRNLWQARLLVPAIIPFSIPASLGILSVSGFDSKRLHLSFIIRGIVAGVVFVNLLNLALNTIYRNPLAAAMGITSRESFTDEFQPGYAAMLKLVEKTPKDANIYSLFEPRSYGVPRNIQPDTLLDNFPHDVFLFKNPKDIIRAWQAAGYSYVLVSKRGSELVIHKTRDREILNETLSLLRPASELSNEDYSLYEIRNP